MITKEFLQEHFKKYDSITLYKPDNTPVTIFKQYNIVLQGGHSKFTFTDYESLVSFYQSPRGRSNLYDFPFRAAARGLVCKTANSNGVFTLNQKDMEVFSHDHQRLL